MSVEIEAKPELVLTIGGEEYGFSELRPEQVDRLAGWIKARKRHPLEVLKDPNIDALTEKERDRLFTRAMEKLEAWPPRLATLPEQAELMATRAGQVELMHEALMVHRPDTTREEAERIYRQLDAETEADIDAAREREEKVNLEDVPFSWIFQTAFGRGHLVKRGA